MSGEPETNKPLKLNDVWRTCNKIRAAIHRIGINLSDHFMKLDPKANCLISEAKFINVFGQQLRGIIGLADMEIAELADYFRVQDGRIAYKQLCNVIEENVLDHTANADLVTGLEWEDPTHCNRLSPSERRRLCLLLTKIAHTVRLRELVVRPYFQDYELIAKNAGTVTLAHFARVLHFIGVVLSDVDFTLLVKRFLKDSYTVNYVAFVHELEQVVRYLDGKRLMDYGEDLLQNFPGRLIDAELPKLPRPETGRIDIGSVFGMDTSFHPVLAVRRADRDTDHTMLRIRRHTLDNQIRCADFFQSFDALRSGFITGPQFLRGLDRMGVSGAHRLHLSDGELANVLQRYADTDDTQRINWKQFELDVDDGLTTVRNLDKRPYEIVVVPPPAVLDVEPAGQASWAEQTDGLRSQCDVAMLRVKEKIAKRRLYLEPMFRGFDKINIGHVSRSQTRQVLLSGGILLANQEIYALMRRFCNDLGFDYARFLREVDPRDDFGNEYTAEFRAKQAKINEPRCPPPVGRSETDIVQVLAKIKGQSVRRRMRIADFVQTYDVHRELCVRRADFRRGLDAAAVQLTEAEVDLVCEVFKSPLRPDYVEYKRFCSVIEEAFHQPCLERAPLIVPLQHFPSDSGAQNFLNFEERTIVTQALQTLSKHSDQTSNLRELCADFDRTNCGTINRNQFLRVLTTRGLHNAVSSRAFEVLCKCFAVERGLRLEVDYRTLLRNLDVLAAAGGNLPL